MEFLEGGSEEVKMNFVKRSLRVSFKWGGKCKMV